MKTVFKNMTNLYLLILTIAVCTALAFTCLSKGKGLSDKISLRHISVGTNIKKYSDGQTYIIYVPEKCKENPCEITSILVIVHGYTGNQAGQRGIEITKKNLERWTKYAEKYNCILLAPHFDELTFDNDYQRLNLDGKRSDLRLNAIVDTVKTAFPELKQTKLKLFGFSGGGQFVHRYCAFHPDMVDRAVIGASGWYMWPDSELDYPLGTNLKSYPNVNEKIDLPRYVQSDMLVIVGENDQKQGSFRDNYKDADLDILQGENRLERAKRWVNELNIIAYKNNVKCSVQLKVAENTAHEINGSLLKTSAEFLFE
jgi:pimeloyl-ACP methyl ester carboxylesterase